MGVCVIIPDISKAISWLEKHPNALKVIFRGIEREALRVRLDGHIASSKHPKSFGAPLKHEWITTDFSEVLLEFITPSFQNIEYMLAFLRDIHRYVARKLNHERMWPFSMPCIIENPDLIKLARYGNSNIAKVKMLYRYGLKNRYGALMQVISGIHYNFSLPFSFWQEWADVDNMKNCKEIISHAYLKLIRNYYRYGWIISYLFGASPAICSTFLQGRDIKFPFKSNEKGTLWLPYATSLRLSDLGYSNNLQDGLEISFNSINDYIFSLRKALRTPSKKFSKIGIKDKNGKFLQLNTNLLQIENEFYAPIRPKRLIFSGERITDALLRDGIEYVEIRSLDINPFSAIGIEANQVRFLDLFLIWCMLVDSPSMNMKDLKNIRENWNTVLLEGIRLDQVIKIGDGKKKCFLRDFCKLLLNNLRKLAEILDERQENMKYQAVCDELSFLIDDSNLTYSARMLSIIKDNGLIESGLVLAERYHNLLMKEPFEVLTEEDFNNQAIKSIIAQQELEANDILDFETYLKNSLNFE